MRKLRRLIRTPRHDFFAGVLDHRRAYSQHLAHPGPGAIPVGMFLLLLGGAVGSVLVAFRVRWSLALMALAVIPASAAYLIPGLMVMASVLIAARVDRRLDIGVDSSPPSARGWALVI